MTPAVRTQAVATGAVDALSVASDAICVSSVRLAAPVRELATTGRLYPHAPAAGSSIPEPQFLIEASNQWRLTRG
jgi:hypothetical protein